MISLRLVRELKQAICVPAEAGGYIVVRVRLGTDGVPGSVVIGPFDVGDDSATPIPIEVIVHPDDWPKIVLGRPERVYGCRVDYPEVVA